MAGKHVLGVANAVLDAAWRKGISVSPMQLQKLLYFCNGWNIEIRGEPLVADNFEAWQFGPVHPEAYHEFKRFGSSQITELADSPFDLGPWRADLSEGEARLVDEVIGLYGQLSGPQMSHLTHQADTPWDQTWRGGMGKGDDIKPDLIRAHFEELRKRAAA